MAIGRVSDAQTFRLLSDRAGSLQTAIRDLNEQIASGKRLVRPEQDPLGAGHVVRINADLAALGQYQETSNFGTEVLNAEDKALAEAHNLMVRAEEIATQQANGLLSASERLAAREEVHGILQALTSLGNSEFLGRRLWGGLAVDATAPFADPDSGGYTAATAYVGSTQEFSVKIGGSAAERVRVSTRGDTVFSNALVAVESLEQTLAVNGNAATSLAGLAQGRADIARERASVGGRSAQLLGRVTQVKGVTEQETAVRSQVQDADLVSVLSTLAQAQTALQALLQAGSRTIQTSLASLLQV
ncbi:MAG: hypothetical protein U0807_00795 [Candidatus Binatia bacterium]